MVFKIWKRNSQQREADRTPICSFSSQMPVVAGGQGQEGVRTVLWAMGAQLFKPLPLRVCFSRSWNHRLEGGIELKPSVVGCDCLNH